ncbi:MAG: hypothetical protein IPH18_14180 [Chitinophagaceae bacterium]|nr:hypothetical protein [Chitinophagaceae bacterium]
MKRILLFLGFCLILPFVAKSQLTKDYWLVGGTGSFFSYNDDFTTTGSPTVSGKLTEVNLSAHVGDFLWGKFAAGLRPGISSTKSRGLNSASAGTKNVTFFLGPFARYYLLNKEKQFNFLIDGVYQWGSHSNYGANGTFRNASIMAGPELFFNTTVGIEILMGYLYQNKTIKNDQPGFSSVRKGFYMSAGFQIHLTKN